MEGLFLPSECPVQQGRQTDRQSDVGSADLEVTTGSEGNRTQTEGSEDGYLSPFLERQGQKRVD